jgi:hypothetical protein
MREGTKKGSIIGVLVVAAVILIGGTLLIGWFFFGRNGAAGPVSFRGWVRPVFGRYSDEFESNGARIYFTGTSETRPTITAEMPGMHRMPCGMMGCASCLAIADQENLLLGYL